MPAKLSYELQRVAQIIEHHVKVYNNGEHASYLNQHGDRVDVLARELDVSIEIADILLSQALEIQEHKQTIQNLDEQIYDLNKENADLQERIEEK